MQAGAFFLVDSQQHRVAACALLGVHRLLLSSGYVMHLSAASAKLPWLEQGASLELAVRCSLVSRTNFSRVILMFFYYLVSNFLLKTFHTGKGKLLPLKLFKRKPSVSKCHTQE